MKRKTAVLPTTTHLFVANGKVTVKVNPILLESAEQVPYYTHMLQTAQQIAEQVALHTQRAANPASHCLQIHLFDPTSACEAIHLHFWIPHVLFPISLAWADNGTSAN